MIKKNSIDIVSFHLYDSYCAIELSSIREIVRPSAIYPIPNSLDTIVGLINVRGVVIPVSDPFFIFTDGYEIDRERIKKHILIFDNAENPLGMIVDYVEKVQPVKNTDLEQIDNFNITHIDNKYILNVIRQLNKQLELETVYLLNPTLLMNYIYAYQV